jgi:hypothetical protein
VPRDNPRATPSERTSSDSDYWSFSTRIRWSDVARDMLPSAPVSVVPDDACPVLLGLIAFASAPLAPEVSLDEPLVAPLVAPAADVVPAPIVLPVE